MKRSSTRIFTMFSAVLAGLAISIALQTSPLGKTAWAASPKAPPPKLGVDETPLSRDARAGTSFAPVIKKVAPSVVNIYSTMTVRERPNQLFDDPFFRRFFGDEYSQRQPRARREQSLGSGVIVSSDGYILTANHVVEGSDRVRVALASGEQEFDAKIIGTDPPTDTAVLKVEGKNLPAITLADSDKLEVGDVVLAIGNPFNVGQTVSMGIVSALRRGGFGITGYENFIQTDAAINPGNSGGPLVDAQGRLVGINTWIISRSGGFQGLGFAVPINMARYVMDRLTTEGKVARGYLGLSLQPDLSPELVRQFKLPDMNGALVTTVEPDSPAAKAGFQEGDFIVEFDGKKVTDMRQLRLMVSQTAPGTKVKSKLVREGTEKTLTATLGTMPEEALARTRRTPQSERGQSKMDALDGVEVTDIDSRTRRQLEIPNNVRGALVGNVEQDSNAAEAGLRPGDVILEIDRQPVRDAESAVTLSEKTKSDRLLLRIWRAGDGRGGMFYLTVDNTKRK